MSALPLFDWLSSWAGASQKAPQKHVPRPQLRESAPGAEIIHHKIGARDIPVHIYRVRGARNLNLSLRRDGQSLRLSLPLRTARKAGLDFITEKTPLILQWLDAMPKLYGLDDGETLPFKGEIYKIIHNSARPRGVEINNGCIVVGGAGDMAAKRLLRWLKAEAKIDFSRMAEKVAAAHGLRPRSVRISNAGSRWGSCSSTGDIFFSWRLLCAPDAARFYVVCHELAHLRHMNHSDAFWQEVARLGGDLEQRRWFRSHGPKVMAIAAV